jgi:hypothetical protein
LDEKKEVENSLAEEIKLEFSPSKVQEKESAPHIPDLKTKTKQIGRDVECSFNPFLEEN